jgi:hypothetical protein
MFNQVSEENAPSTLRVYEDGVALSSETLVNISTRTLDIASQKTVASLTHSCSRALLEKLPILQPLKNFPAFYGTRRFITAFTRALHWSLS